MKSYLILVAVVVVIAMKVAAWGFDVVSETTAKHDKAMTEIVTMLR